MKILVATAMYPTAQNPAFGSFVRSQVEMLRRAGIEIKLLVLEGRSRKWMYPKAMAQLRQLLADKSIDLIHAHYGYVGMVARTQWQVPVVLTFHGDDLLGTRNDHGKLTPASKVVAAAGQALGYTVDAAIVQNQQMAAKLKGANVHIIPHEVDFEIFHPIPREEARAQLGLANDKRYLLFAANPAIAVKRFPLAKAVADRMTRNDPDLELIVVYKEPQERLNLYMNACDALVFTSYQEGSPNIIKQAMACNLPIVSTDVGDVREVIERTEGCAISDPTPEAFATRLAEILRRGKRTIGRQHIGHFHESVVSRRLIQLYTDVLARRRRYRGTLSGEI